MAVPFEIPEWLVAQSAPPPPPPVDDHRVESLVNGFIAGKQDALFDAPDAYYRQQGADALDGAPAASVPPSRHGSTPISTTRWTASAATSRHSGWCSSATRSARARR